MKTKSPLGISEEKTIDEGITLPDSIDDNDGDRNLDEDGDNDPDTIAPPTVADTTDPPSKKARPPPKPRSGLPKSNLVRL